MPIVDLIAPQALSFRQDTIVFGDQVGAVLVVTDYPPRVGPAWLEQLAKLPGVSLSMQIAPADTLELVSALNKSIVEFQSRLAAQSGQPLQKERSAQSLQDAKELMRKIDQESHRVFRVAVFLLVLGRDEQEIRQRIRRVEGACAAAGMRARAATFRQEPALLSAGPWAVFHKEMNEAVGREMPAETIAAAYPWVTSGLNHGRGCLWGRDSQGGVVLIDRWNRPPDSGMANANSNILGTSGARKSTTEKIVLLREYALGARIIVLDPEREYRSICRQLGGTWINAAGGQGKVNPLHISPIPDSYDEEDGEDSAQVARSPLARKMQRLKAFFGLYLRSLDDLERALLEDAILAAYADFGVTWDTDPASIAEWPTLADVRRHVSAMAGGERVGILLKSATEGADSHLWQGQTAIPAGGDFIVFDLHELMDAAENVRRAQYFTILGYAWDMVREGRAHGERTHLLSDETWILADPQTPEALAFLRDLSKRIRKYGGSLNVSTQNIGDFFSPELARFGKPIIDNASVKFLMRQEAGDLEVLRSLLHLSDAEAELLGNAPPGEGLLIAGNQRVKLRVEPSPYELELLGIVPDA